VSGASFLLSSYALWVAQFNRGRVEMRLGRQVFNADEVAMADPKRRPFRNRGDMRDSRKESAGEKETDGARDHSASSIFAIIFSAFCRRSSMYASTAPHRLWT
jgi:hypothetical protein